jgi:hypothetical protein
MAHETILLAEYAAGRRRVSTDGQTVENWCSGGLGCGCDGSDCLLLPLPVAHERA